MSSDKLPSGSGESIWPGCGLTATDTGHAPSDEHVASAACYRVVGQLLARDYSDPDCYRRAHQMVVDAYAAQHAGGEPPGDPDCRAVPDDVVPVLRGRCRPCRGAEAAPADGRQPPGLSWLQPPPQQHLLTVAHALPARNAEEHERLVREWAAQVWRAWAPHHAIIRQWNGQALG